MMGFGIHASTHLPALQQSTEPDDRVLAGGIQSFVVAMPKIDTEWRERRYNLTRIHQSERTQVCNPK
jgi:hypothetical protein